ncbi:ribonuclease H-like domain-containing protein [Palaeococcus sp. (in: euryarchaeotes)]
MKIVAFSDWRVQNIGKFIEYLSTLKQKPDIIVYAGDDISRFNGNTSKNYFEKFAKLSKYGLVAVAGNDDIRSVRSLIKGKDVYNLHDIPLILDDYAFIGLEGATKPPGILLHSESYVKKHLNKKLKEIPKDKKIIVVSHTPPYGILDMGIRFGINHIGSTALREFIEENHNRIKLVICGHAHSQGGKIEKYLGMYIINCASHDYESAPGNVAIIDIGGDVYINWIAIHEWGWASKELSQLMSVPLVGYSRAQTLLDAGIDSIEKLSNLPLNHPLSKNARFGGIFESIVNYAKAIALNQPIVKGIHPFFENLDEKNIYFFDTEYVPKRQIFLIGWMNRTGKVHQLFLDNPQNEKSMLEEFREWLILEKPILVAYSSKSADMPQLIRAFRRFDIPTNEVKNAFFDLYYDCINTFSIKKQYIFLPMPNSMSLKDISRYLGYAEPEDVTIKNGIDALSQYLQFLNTGDEKIKRELLKYNKTDLDRLKFVFEKIKDLMENWAGE